MAIYHVSGGGDALQTAINSAAANDILLVDDGVYSPITCNKTLTISGLHGYENCIIDGDGVKRCATRTENRPKIYGFTCRNGYTISGDGQNTAGDCGGIYNFYTVQDCAIYDCSCSENNAALVIPANGNATQCLISGCYADNYVICVGSSSQPTYWSYLSVLNNSIGGVNTNQGSMMLQCSNIDHCVFDGNQGSTKATNIIHPNITSRKPIVSNCVFRNNKSRGGSANYIIADAQVDNCIFYNNGTSSLKFRSCVQDCGIKNCTFYGNQVNYGDVIRTKRQGNSYIIPLNYIDNSIFTKLDVRGNIYANNQIVQVRNCRFNNYYIDNNNLSVTTFTDCTSGVAIDTAQFVNTSSRNFHLLGTSPCISAGNYNLVPDSNRDLDGKLYRNPPSMGAYQFYKSIEGEIPNYINPVGQRERAPWSEIEYLESTGTQWIDLGFYPDSTTQMEVDGQFTVDMTTNANSCGTNSTSGSRLKSFTMQYRSGSTFLLVTYGVNLAPSDLERHVFKLNGYGRSYVDANHSNAANTYDNGQVNQTMVMFAYRGNRNTIERYARFRVYSIKVVQNSTLILDLIPFRVGNVGYLFDKVTKKLFKNQGTGAFILGQDKN